MKGLDRHWEFQEVKTPRFQDKWHMKVVPLSALRTSPFYPPGNIPGTHFWFNPPRAIVQLEGLCQWKIPTTPPAIDRDLPACSAAPQTTAPPRTPRQNCIIINVGFLVPSPFEILRESSKHYFLLCPRFKVTSSTSNICNTPAQIHTIHTHTKTLRRKGQLFNYLKRLCLTQYLITNLIHMTIQTHTEHFHSQ